MTGIFGPSGSGKTTLLRMIAGLERPEKGWMTLGGRHWQDEGRFTAPFRRPIGYVFQDARLFPHLSVAGNLDFAIKRAGPSETPAHRDELVAEFGLEHLMERRIAGLSGGERQRVAIVRALLSHPRLLLMDEPLASLDRDSRREILPYLENLVRRSNIPVLYVSHDLTEIERFADTLVLMDKGRVIATGPIADLAADPDLPLARDPDAAALVDVTIAAYDSDYELTTCRLGPHTLVLPGKPGAPGGAQRLRIKASDVSITLFQSEKHKHSQYSAVPDCRDGRARQWPESRRASVAEHRDAVAVSGDAALARCARGWFPGLNVHAQIKGITLVDIAR